MKVAVVLLVLLSCICTSLSQGTSNGAALYENDVHVLQTATYLEEETEALYKAALSRFQFLDFVQAGFDVNTYELIVQISQQHSNHAQSLRQALASLNSEALPPCTYNFPLATIDDFLNLASSFANVTVSVYEQLIQDLTTKELMVALYRMNSVNAHHVAFLEYFSGRNPFPSAFEATSEPSNLNSLLSPYANCSYSRSSVNPTEIFYQPASSSDVSFTPAVLNANNQEVSKYLHSAERLISGFYSWVLDHYSASSFRAAGYSNEDYIYFGYIHQHHLASVQAFATLLGTKAYPNCTFTFPQYGSLQEYFMVAQQLEELAISLHGGSLSYFSDESYPLLISTIAAVEARHSAWLREENQQPLFPEPAALYSPSQGIQMLAQFQKCPFNFTMPTQLPYPPGDLFPSPKAAAPPVPTYLSSTQYYETGLSFIGCDEVDTMTTPSTPNTVNINIKDLF